ncbi:MAG: cupin domain-containing protein, partial [Bacillus cereus]|nr:cupin domain-containing protein [Bacillus cereus]
MERQVKSMTSNIDYTSPSTNFTHDLNKSNY